MTGPARHLVCALLATTMMDPHSAGSGSRSQGCSERFRGGS